MNEENKHVFYDSTSVWLSVNCDEGKLTEFKVDVPVRIDSTGAMPFLKDPALDAPFQARVRVGCNSDQLQTAVNAGVEAFQKAFNESMELRGM